MMYMMNMWGGPWSFKGKGKGKGTPAGQCKWCQQGDCWDHKDSKKCSVHGKIRSLNAMEDDGAGGFKCQASMMCQMGASDPNEGSATCSVHDKNRSMNCLEEDGAG